MSYTLTIKAFFFNAKTDYLPYYKNFTCVVPKDAQVKAILEAIQAQNENFAYPESKLVFRINDMVVVEETTVAEVVEKLGTTLKIDPVSSYRSNNGLIINDADFMQSFAHLAPYASEEDKSYYQTLYALHYASETSNFERDYIGDAVLVLAHTMIAQGNPHKKEILEAIATAPSGLFSCEYENNLLDAKLYTQEIESLKEMSRAEQGGNFALFDSIKKRFAKAAPEAVEIESLAEKCVAYYPHTHSNQNVLEKIDALEIPMVTFDRMHKACGLSVLKDNRELAFKKAGAILLEAFDAGAEVLIVEEKASYEMFTKHFKAIENTIGRKIIGLELISTEDFMLHSAVSVA